MGCGNFKLRHKPVCLRRQHRLYPPVRSKWGPGLPPGRAPLETRLLGWGGKASRGYRVCAAHSMDGGPEHKQQPAHLWGEARPKMQLEVWTMHWATLLPCDV